MSQSDNIMHLTGTFTEFVSRCVTINKAYMQKHFELMRMFAAFRMLTGRFKDLRASLDRNTDMIMKLIASSDQSILKVDELNALVKEQANMAQEVEQFDHEIDEIGEQCMKMLTEINNATRSLQQSH